MDKIIYKIMLIELKEYFKNSLCTGTHCNNNACFC